MIRKDALCFAERDTQLVCAKEIEIYVERGREREREGERDRDRAITF